MEARKNTHFSIVMFPWLAHGHVFPYLELAKNLSKKNFTIYFCSTAINLTSVNDLLKKSSSNIQLVELHLPAFPDLPPNYHTTKNLPPHLISRLLEAFHKSKSSFAEIIQSLKPDLLIYDLFHSWAAKFALSLGIPAVNFATTGAAAYSFYYHYRVHKARFPYQELFLKENEVKSFSNERALYDHADQEDEESQEFDPFKQSHELILMRSCKAIEGKYMDYLSLLIQKNVVPVGTLVSEDLSYIDQHHSEDRIMEWLSNKKNSSTVFISFGSENYLSKVQMEELAKGLELCDYANFIWVVRFPSGYPKVSLEEALPMGFLEKVGERGMILEGWAPQSKILGHPSIGAFVSHCGMSSIFESAYFGVPVVAIPLKFDQPLNARLMVGVGVGVEVTTDEDGNLRRDTIASVINQVLSEKSGKEMRLKAAELCKKMKSEEEQAMNEAAEQLQRLCLRSKQQN